MNPSYKLSLLDRNIHFVLLAMSALGISEASFDTISTMKKDLSSDNRIQMSIIKKIVRISTNDIYFAVETRCGVQLHTYDFLLFLFLDRLIASLCTRLLLLYGPRSLIRITL